MAARRWAMRGQTTAGENCARTVATQAAAIFRRRAGVAARDCTRAANTSRLLLVWIWNGLPAMVPAMCRDWLGTSRSAIWNALSGRM